MAEYDIVCPVREGAANSQLRYALRSWAANLPHRRVWLIGYRPPWAADVGHVPIRQTGTKYKNTTAAVRVAIEHPEITERFILCNDDFFAMKPQPEELPVYHRGLVWDVEAYYATRGNGAYLRGLRETRGLLARLGHADPLSYELHVPLPVSKAGMLNALETGRHLDVLHKRTAYGVLAGIGGEYMADVKVLRRAPHLRHERPVPVDDAGQLHQRGCRPVHPRRIPAALQVRGAEATLICRSR